MSTNAVEKDAVERMDKTIAALKHTFISIRAGRANASLLEQVEVEYYGQSAPITQVATVTVEDAHTLKVVPWDKQMVSSIEKAVLNADLGLNPVSAGDVIRVPLPPLTEDRRRELIKVAKHEAENARVAVRNIRRDANNELRRLAKDKIINEDEEKRAENVVQQLTNTHIEHIDRLLQDKERDLLDV